MSARDWFWIRHGPTHAKCMVGWLDLPADLSDTAAMTRLSAALPEAPVVSSDLTRAVTTADAVQGARARLPHEQGLREMNFGAWDGLTFDQAQARDPERLFTFWDQPGAVQAPDGESWDDLTNRVNDVVDRLDATLPPGPIIAVAHFGVIVTQVQRALGISAYAAFGHKIDNLSLTHLRLGETTEALAINQIL